MKPTTSLHRFYGYPSTAGLHNENQSISTVLKTSLGASWGPQGHIAAAEHFRKCPMQFERYASCLRANGGSEDICAVQEGALRGCLSIRY
jgi:hypothetical protein